MEDLIYLIARYTVRVNVDNRSMGTGGGDISLSATAVAENEGRKLTAYTSVWGRSEQTAELREEVVCSAFARLRRQIEALEALS